MPIDKNNPRFQALARGMRSGINKGKPVEEDKDREARLSALRALSSKPNEAAAPTEEPKVEYDTPLTEEEKRNREYLKNKYNR